MAKGDPWSYLEPLLQQALGYLAEEQREIAAKIAVLGEMGHAEMEIAAEVGLSWHKMNTVRLSLQGGVIKALRVDGWSDPEIRLGLGIASSTMASAIAALAPNYVLT